MSDLRTARAIREHCAEVAGEAIAGRSPHFRWHDERLPAVADYVVEVIRSRYPDLRVPFHSRWRHFEAGGRGSPTSWGQPIDRWKRLADARGLRGVERAKAAVDLVIPSVLLDAGAGPSWRYVERETGQAFTRSEGLGIASLDLYASGGLADLSRVRPEGIARAFQVGPDNPLVGVEGRAALLAKLGGIVASQPEWFGNPPRLGNLVDAWRARARDGRIAAADLLRDLLVVLEPMWPGRGDCWPHPAARGGLVPFHKLTQWLSYSLLEPLADAGLEVTELDSLTGLPEYRNGGLLVDLGLVEARDRSFQTRALRVDEPAVVEWRALTVVALDRLAPLVRERLGMSESAFPLARMLEGGTWAAGRKIALERRPGGTPPVHIESDGTVF
jgi:hypothetical protein